jgi:Na+/H+ antiporter NhaD/arsenite permease-like protein
MHYLRESFDMFYAFFYRIILLNAVFLVSTFPVQAASLEGGSMSALWGLPFIGMLLSIALGPLLFPDFWHHHYGKISAGWSLLTLVPLVIGKGFGVAFAAFVHVMLAEYVSFIIVLFALFTVAGGIVVEGNIKGRPITNTALLTIGAVLASVIGTTGASMVMIHPLLRANDSRVHNVHVFVFFIFLVSNIGGALTPLGDPPLFVGFLRGVDFFWTTTHLFTEMVFVMGLLLVIFYLMDVYFYKKDMAHHGLIHDPTPLSGVALRGLVNVPLIGIIIGAILLSAIWKPHISFDIFGTSVALQNIVRDVVLVVAALISLKVTQQEFREANDFNWEPIKEVAKLFFGIFVCMIPVLAILNAGKNGAAAPLIALVTNADGTANNAAYFWMTGILSSFLDNVPTYVVFFEMAGGNAKQLMTTDALTLAAISSGAVFMGANSYIGNAPNFMVYAIAKKRGVKMPSFFGYLLWSGAILIPVFWLTTLLFFQR